MKPRIILAIAAAIGLACPGLASPRPAPAAPATLTIALRPSLYQEAQRRLLFRPFTEATGIAIREVPWPDAEPARPAPATPSRTAPSRPSPGPRPGAGRTEKTAPAPAAPPAHAAPAPIADIAELPAELLLAGCRDGLFEPPDWTAIGGRDHYLPQAIGECGVGATLTATVLAWDRDKQQVTPAWADFWDVARTPGRRGLRRGPEGNLELALLADGVAPADVYHVLAAPEGVDRAFRKLDQLRPYIAWWDTPAQALQLLGSGGVLLTTAEAPRVFATNAARHRHFGVQWDEALTSMESWAVLKGSPNRGAALRFLAFAADPARQAAFTRATFLGGLARQPAESAATLQEISPSAPAHLAASLPIDAAFWAANRAALTRRFDAWLAH
ncbi:MAG TPA: extracellular solute-binding protein [Acetobacteraceae bacterium]|nr:extracellular solute-binding protein [Acetobacteraceae bacterium]